MFKVTSKMCMTKDLGMNGNLFGGNMLAWMDEAAAIFAHTITGEPRMVTLKFEEIVFKRPVKLGDIVDFHCEPIRVGETSFTFRIYGKVDDTEVFGTVAVFVAVDEIGNKKNIERKIEIRK